MKHSFIALFIAIFALPAWAEEPVLPAGTYQLDKSHASLLFSVNHIGFSHYTMSFDRFDATLNLDPAHPEKASVKATIDPRSLDLPSPPEGFTQTILGKEWLNTKQFPQISFTSTHVERTGEKTANVHGTLELLGVKKPVVLAAVFNGGYKGHPMDPKARIGFSATTSFNRSDFGMNYGIPAPGTTMGVSDLVKVTIEAEFSGPPLQETTKEKH
jgi:polyisoprenoid-binding protein YceI